jgi:AcrR family transcriptional regulator
VDHAQRRQEIADALWRVLRRDGFAGASVRTVAAEAGWSTGSIRHYFSSQNELIAFAMQTLTQQVQERIAAVGAEVRDLAGVVDLLEEVLPMDAQRRAEAEVWLALSAAARTDDELRVITEESHRGLRRLCQSSVRLVVGEDGGGRDLVLETDRLHALLDGLALHGTMHPRLMPRTRIRAALLAHLVELDGG